MVRANTRKVFPSHHNSLVGNAASFGGKLKISFYDEGFIVFEANRLLITCPCIMKSGTSADCLGSDQQVGILYYVN